MAATGRKTFIVTDADGHRSRHTPEEILHIVGYSLDGIMGVSRIEYCRQTLGTAIARDKFEGVFYRQGTRVPGVIEYPGQLQPQGIANLAESFKALHGGVQNMHKVPVLEMGATFKPVSMTMEDMQFVEGAQLSRSEIAMMFDLPAAYLNASTGDSLTYATQESNQIQFAQMAIAPITNRIARAVSADPEILPWNVMYCSFVLEGLMRGDMKTRAEYWAVLKNLGVVDNKFIASRENLPEPPPEPATPRPLVNDGLAATKGNGNGNGAVDLEQLMASQRSRQVEQATRSGVTFAEGAITSKRRPSPGQLVNERPARSGSSTPTAASRPRSSASEHVDLRRNRRTQRALQRRNTRRSVPLPPAARRRPRPGRRGEHGRREAAAEHRRRARGDGDVHERQRDRVDEPRRHGDVHPRHDLGRPDRRKLPVGREAREGEEHGRRGRADDPGRRDDREPRLVAVTAQGSGTQSATVTTEPRCSTSPWLARSSFLWTRST